MDTIAYDAIAAAGGIPKPKKNKKGGNGGEGVTRPNCSLKTRTGLKKTIKVIPAAVKVETLKQKGNLCFMGFCEVCGGTARVTIEDGLHHFPHKGPHSTPDDPKYLWPAKPVCQGHYHDHPLEERELFKRIEAANLPRGKVYWTVPKKGDRQ